MLGDGTFGSVRSAHRFDNPSKHFAIKSLKKSKINNQRLLEEELEILSALDHPNIIKFFEFYQDNIFFHIIMELCTGPELFSYVLNNKHLDENKIIELSFKIVGALHYSHNEGIIHRDLKLENVMFENNQTESCQIKIIDWGLSSKFELGKPLSTITGTFQYIAPEVFDGSYDDKCDIWSLGVITFVLFTKTYPFMGKEIKEYLVNLKNEKISYDSKYFSGVSKNALEFISLCLEKDPSKRINISQCYNHPWFKQIRKKLSTSELDHIVLKNLRSYEKPSSRLKSFIFDHFINLILTSEDIQLLRNQFQYMDLNGQGYININELMYAYKRANIKMDENEIKDIISKIDTNNNNMLNYSEFLIAAVDQKKIIEKDNLIKVFNYFDEDNTGYIDRKNINSLLQRTMRSKKTILSDEEFLEIVEDVAKKGVGNSEKIYLSDFLGFFGVDLG